MEYYYGMRLRHYGIGCQPSGARLVKLNRYEYFDCIVYDKQLSNEDVDNYSLDFLGVLSDSSQPKNAVNITVKTSFEVAVILWKIMNELDPYCEANYSEAEAIKDCVQLSEEENIQALKETFNEYKGEIPENVKNLICNMYPYLDNGYLLEEIINN